MNPNSRHQIWSRWTATVVAPTTLPYDTVRTNCARFYRKAFGSPTELRIVANALRWTIDCRTEGHPAHDPTYVAWMTAQLRQFLANGFGAASAVRVDVTVEAGDTQDGTPADQMIGGPPPVVLVNQLLKKRG